MLPKPHIILGAIFSVCIKLVFPQIDWMYVGLIFLSAFLIDFDHYLFVVMKTRNWSLINALNWFEVHGGEERNAGRIGPKARKSPFFLLHTIEFHILVLLMGYFWIGFWYVFIGMALHSILDVADMVYRKELHCRWFSLIDWLIKKN